MPAHTCYVDLDGTLCTYDVPFSTIYGRALERLDVENAGFDAFSRHFFDVFGEASDPYATAIAATDVPVDPQSFSDSLATTEIDHTVALPGAARLLEHLGDTHQVGVLTNGRSSLQREKLHAIGLEGAVDALIVSSAVGAWKPDPRIYEIAEERLPADSYTFVSDDLERDLVPALERGWTGIHVTDGREQSPSLDPALGSRVHTATTLEDCLEYVSAA